MSDLPERERNETESVNAEPHSDDTPSTVGTGSAIALGCLVVVVVLVVLAIAFRLLGGSW